MHDCVYVVHAFVPENDDEIALRLGDRVEVLEKDDLFGDGWWKGINTSGRTGLFPQRYTSPIPVPEESDPEIDMSDVEKGDESHRNHKQTRETLAERAKQVVARRPPIDVELSDESEDELEVITTQRAFSAPQRSSIKTTSSSSSDFTASSSSELNTVSTLPTPMEPNFKKEKAHPTEWTAEDVVEWLKNKGFDDDVCNKFIEQEITGDVLFNLNVELLKTEIGIVAYGKRVRLAHAIASLRTPPSILPDPLPTILGSPLYESPSSLGRRQLLHHCRSGSLKTPSSVHTFSVARHLPLPKSITNPHLSHSPSDGALSASYRASAGDSAMARGRSLRHGQSALHISVQPVTEEATAEAERAAFSDGEALRKPMNRRRTFSRAKSVEPGENKDRLSLFAGTFGGTIRRKRKPAPKYSGEDIPSLSEKSSAFALARFANINRKGSGRPIDNGQFALTSNPPLNQESKEVLRARTASMKKPHDKLKLVASPLKPNLTVLSQLENSEHSGWIRKRGKKFGVWKLRYCVLNGSDLYWLKSDDSSQTTIKGYLNIVNYRLCVDEHINPGKYNFRLEHEPDKMHFFSSDDKAVIREWMKVMLKATIMRDFSQPVASSCNVSTIPLMVAQSMNPPPRPPSPSALNALQRARRPKNPHQLSSRDARVLMGFPGTGIEIENKDHLGNHNGLEPGKRSSSVMLAVPPSPRLVAGRRKSVVSVFVPIDDTLITWANTHLAPHLHISSSSPFLGGGLELFRIAESILPSSSATLTRDEEFGEDRLDGLFKLFDFLLDNEVNIGSVSINDVRMGNREKVVQVLKALREWEVKRNA